MPIRNTVITQAQPQALALTRGIGGRKELKNLCLHRLRPSCTIGLNGDNGLPSLSLQTYLKVGLLSPQVVTTHYYLTSEVTT